VRKVSRDLLKTKQYSTDDKMEPGVLCDMLLGEAREGLQSFGRQDVWATKVNRYI